MLKILEANEIDKERWEALVKASSVANWFQTIEAFHFYSTLSFMEAFAFGVENDGNLRGVVVGYVQRDGGRMRRFFSRRAIVTGGPLLADDITGDELKALLCALRKQLKRKAIFIETRNFNDYSRWREPFAFCGFKYEPHYDIWVDTSSMDVVHSNLGKSRKRDIRVSLRDGAAIVEHPTKGQIRDYYLILNDLYKNKVKTPLVEKEFFDKLYQRNDAVFLFVEYGGKIVGGTVCVGLSGDVLYELYVCGEDNLYKNIFPSELATFAGLQYAAENGYSRFDMMGAGRPDDGGYGVRDFKLKFGGQLMEFGRYVYINKLLLYHLGKLGVKLMKRF